MDYSLSNLNPDVVEALQSLLDDPDEIQRFLVVLGEFLKGSGQSSAENDLAFSVAAELNAGGVLDQIPLSQLKETLVIADGVKSNFFIRGLPRRLRVHLEEESVVSAQTDEKVIGEYEGTVRGDPIGKLLTRIRNAQDRGESIAKTPASKLRSWVLDILEKEGYIAGYEPSISEGGRPELTVSLKYFGGEPVLKELKRVEAPGRRVYLGSKDVPKARVGMLVSVIPISDGVSIVRMNDGVSIVRTENGNIVGAYNLVERTQ